MPATTNFGMSPEELSFELQRGGRFVVYQYCVSLLVVTFKRNSPVKFIRAGENAAVKGLPFTMLTLVLGWWGIPWGFIYTPQVIYKNLKGGTDITAALLNRKPAQDGVARAAF
ncbi:MAG TPA: hypothetical protein VGN01_08620 [Acidobacteriaceae bacterium]|jgi:hypothetical protein